MSHVIQENLNKFNKGSYSRHVKGYKINYNTKLAIKMEYSYVIAIFSSLGR